MLPGLQPRWSDKLLRLHGYPQEGRIWMQWRPSLRLRECVQPMHRRRRCASGLDVKLLVFSELFNIINESQVFSGLFIW